MLCEPRKEEEEEEEEEGEWSRRPRRTWRLRLCCWRPPALETRSASWEQIGACVWSGTPFAISGHLTSVSVGFLSGCLNQYKYINTYNYDDKLYTYFCNTLNEVWMSWMSLFLIFHTLYDHRNVLTPNQCKVREHLWKLNPSPRAPHVRACEGGARSKTFTVLASQAGASRHSTLHTQQHRQDNRTM